MYTYTERESELLNTLTECCNANNIRVIINPPNWFYEGALVALDVEHDEAGGFVGCGILVSGTSTVYYFSDICLLTGIDFSSLAIVAHNGVSDLDCLRQWGCNVKNEQLVWDTELMAHIIDSSRKGYGLKKLAEADAGIVYPSYEDIVGRRTSKTRRTLDCWPVEIVSKYNALDCYATFRLYDYQITLYNRGSNQPRIVSYFKDLERPVAYILFDMSNRGVRVDLKYLEGLKRTLEAQKAPIEAEIKNELGTINLNSPKQLLEALHAKEIYPELKGKPSTDKRALAQFSSQNVVSNLLRYSELDTLLSGFCLPYLERGQEVVHPFFNQCGTRTGRLSCSNPNLLQIPKKTENGRLVRRMFIPRDGMLMGDCDFGQIEPRVLAHLSKDPAMCKMFNDGVDFHSYTAERLQISRDRAKVLNLSVGYRATFKSVQSQLGGTREEAQNQIYQWWTLFPTLRRWQESLIYEARRSGFCTTLMGRRIRVDSLSDGNSWKREAAERQLINNIAQGSAAEIMKMAMIKIHIANPLIGLLVQVYDELLFESPSQYMEDELNTVIDCMKNAVKLDVPLTVDCKTGTSWADCH